MNQEDKSFDISIPVPIYIGGAFSIDIGIYYTIRPSKENSGTKKVTARWKHNHAQDVSWGAAYSSPTDVKNSTRAYAGRTCMVNFYNQSDPYNIELYGNGNIIYRCQVALSMSSQSFVASATINCGRAKAIIEVK